MATRISQHGIEVLRSEDAPIVRVSHAPVEVLRLPTTPIVRVSHCVVEVLRKLPPVNKRIFPVIQDGLVTNTAASGERIFPIVIVTPTL